MAGKTLVVLCGAGELAEIATLAARGNIKLAGIFDLETNETIVAGLPVVRDLSVLSAEHVFVITDGRKPQELYDILLAAVGQGRVYAPPFLRVSSRQTNISHGGR